MSELPYVIDAKIMDIKAYNSKCSLIMYKRRSPLKNCIKKNYIKLCPLRLELHVLSTILRDVSQLYYL
eukprot:XP_001704977.1 Hypothetical protein GL50803_22147 [Giardia lamblia ATCC 50803]